MCFCAVLKKLKSSSDGGDAGSKKCRRGCGTVWRTVLFMGVWNQVVSFVLVYLTGMWLWYREDVFTI
jgi:hypothetical protein